MLEGMTNFANGLALGKGAVDGMASRRAAGLPFQIHTTAMNWNEPEITELTDFAVSAGVSGTSHFLPGACGRGKDIEDTSLHTEQYESLLGRILDKQQQVEIGVKSRLALPSCAHKNGV